RQYQPDKGENPSRDRNYGRGSDSPFDTTPLHASLDKIRESLDTEAIIRQRNRCGPLHGSAMPLTPSQKPIREWPLLVLTIAIVALICVPLWQSFGSEDSPSMFAWTAERWAQLLLGPEQF